MDEGRKNASRHLLYWAMVFHIRPVRWLIPRGWRAWSVLHWRRQARLVRRAGVIGDWLHNLASFSARDFRGFDEERFWQDFESFRPRYPEFGWEHYREEFERFVAAVEGHDGISR